MSETQCRLQPLSWSSYGSRWESSYFWSLTQYYLRLKITDNVIRFDPNCECHIISNKMIFCHGKWWVLCFPLRNVRSLIYNQCVCAHLKSLSINFISRNQLIFWKLESSDFDPHFSLWKFCCNERCVCVCVLSFDNELTDVTIVPPAVPSRTKYKQNSWVL